MTDANLIFIISQPRSGSTMLQAVISNNGEVASSSEPWLLLHFLSYTRKDLLEAKYNQDWAAEAYKDYIKKIGEANFSEDLKNFLVKQYGRNFKPDTKYFLDKTPRYYEILDEMIAIFPNAKFIILKRNPKDVFRSIVKTWSSLGKFDFGFLLKFRRDLLLAPFKLHQFSIKHAEKANVKTIHFEEFIENSEENFRKLFQWLGITFKEEMLDYSSNNQIVGLMGDPIGVKKFNRPTKKQDQKEKEIQKIHFLNRKFESGYCAYLGKRFLKEYGNYSLESNKASLVFKIYRKVSNSLDLKRINFLSLIASYFS